MIVFIDTDYNLYFSKNMESYPFDLTKDGSIYQFGAPSPPNGRWTTKWFLGNEVVHEFSIKFKRIV